MIREFQNIQETIVLIGSTKTATQKYKGVLQQQMFQQRALSLRCFATGRLRKRMCFS